VGNVDPPIYIKFFYLIAKFINDIRILFRGQFWIYYVIFLLVKVLSDFVAPMQGNQLSNALAERLNRLKGFIYKRRPPSGMACIVLPVEIREGEVRVDP
jgi:hypothetical protein